MNQKVVSFELDELKDWVAVLQCGHKQHVRHQPPLVERPWVLIEEGRKRHVGMILDCRICDEGVSAA